MFEPTTRDGVVRLGAPGADWLSTGWRGGRGTADAAYSVTVPEDWRCDDVAGFVADRVDAAGFDGSEVRDGGAPVLMTGVAARHARGARLGPVVAVATAGLSNPAELPMDPPGGDLPDGELVPGTVNVVAGTTRALTDGALANLVAVVAEAKAATLLDVAGVPGTTSDAVVVASDPTGDPTTFSGSATRVGAAARACVREAVTAALDARYDGDDLPTSVEDARYGVRTDARADVFALDDQVAPDD